MKDIKKTYSGIKGLEKNKILREKIAEYYSKSIGTDDIKISQFPKYIQEIDLQTFLFRAEVFKQILPVHGSILEMGVLFGGGLMTWARLSSIFEPSNYSRKIIGFDTFRGFPFVSKQDRLSKNVQKTYLMKSYKKGEFFADTYNDILQSIGIYNQDRCFGSSPKVELVRGNVSKTLPLYLKENPHLVVSLVNLDLDLYHPTKIALKYLLPRMPKGAIICFDELNHPNWPGETLAVMECLGLNKIKIQRFSFAPRQSYAVLE